VKLNVKQNQEILAYLFCLRAFSYVDNPAGAPIKDRVALLVDFSVGI